MPCLLALIGLSIIGIFSASHRQLAKEAYDCVFKRLRRRPCETGFDVKVKAKVLGPILPRWPKLARWVSQHFELLAWFLMLLTALSLGQTIKGVYNFWAWGDCNGQYATGGFCAFDPTGKNSQTSSEGNECKDLEVASRNLSLSDFATERFPTQILGKSVDKQVVFMGCYSCEYTRKAYPMLRSLAQEFGVKWVMVHFPIKPETVYLQAYDECVYRLGGEAYFSFVDEMMQMPLNQLGDENYILSLMPSFGLSLNEIKACVGEPEINKEVKEKQALMLTTGIYGTPTVFINGTPVVGPRPERVYRRLLK